MIVDGRKEDEESGCRHLLLLDMLQACKIDRMTISSNWCSWIFLKVSSSLSWIIFIDNGSYSTCFIDENRNSTFLVKIELKKWLDLISSCLESKSQSWCIWIWFKYLNLDSKLIWGFFETLLNFASVCYSSSIFLVSEEEGDAGGIMFRNEIGHVRFDIAGAYISRLESGAKISLCYPWVRSY